MNDPIVDHRDAIDYLTARCNGLETKILTQSREIADLRVSFVEVLDEFTKLREHVRRTNLPGWSSQR